MWFRPARGRFMSDFGPRTAPTVGASTFHRGVDIAPPKPGQRGVDVVAAGAGEVIAVGTSTVRGIWVVVRHQDGTATRYQHLASRTVQLKQKVTVGTVLGEMGATGLAVGIHLHYETFAAGTDWTTSTTATDPEPFMQARGVDLRVDTPPPTLEDDDMTPEQDNLLRHAIAMLGEVPERTATAVHATPVHRVEGQPSTALDDAVLGTTAAVESRALLAALTATVATLATAQGADPAVITAAAQAGARAALADLTLTAHLT